MAPRPADAPDERQSAAASTQANEARPRAKTPPDDDAALIDMKPLEIGLINNAGMAAFDVVARRFRSLLGRAAHGRPIRLHMASSPAIDLGHRHIQSIDRLLARHRLDAAIITGAEPSCSRVEDEPYWADVTGFYDWAEAHDIPLIVSCLAAHAVVQHVSGCRRVRLQEKCCGVFDARIVTDHPVLKGVAARFAMPHSRWNTLPARALTDAGFRVLTQAASAGVDSFVGPHRAQQIFLQGHPEYGAASLMAEYQRDIQRFLLMEHETYPALPYGCVHPSDAARLHEFRTQALAHRSEAAMAAFPESACAAAGPAPWYGSAVAMFSNWLDHVDHMRRIEAEHRVQHLSRRTADAAPGFWA